MEKGNFKIDENGMATFVNDPDGKWEVTNKDNSYHYSKIDGHVQYVVGIDPYAEKDLKRVYVTQDYSGHTYVMPYEVKETFLIYSEVHSENMTFAKFSQYSTRGDINLIQLYARI